ncbi:MAG: HD domain-containing protein [Candidatus Hydrogenedentes bacterium]|nr:HD domain-containing protein [Candidatus Hydrogenedentota bacterium]
MTPVHPGIQAARRFAREHDSEPEHAFQVCKTSLQLFDGLVERHGLGAAERRLLEAAALLHDTGYDVDPVRHHKISRDLIVDSRLEGFTKEQLAIVACVARYHRKAHPDQTHRVYRDLSRRARSVVDRLAAILRVGDGLDRSHSACTCGVRIEQKGTALRLLVQQRRPNPIDIEGALRKRQWFEEVFKVRLDIVPVPMERG